MNLKDSDIVVTSVGHAVTVKGWDIAITAFARVCKKIPNIKLLLVGAKTSPKYHHKLCAQITESGLGHNVMFTGSRRDIPEILKASDVFLLPSRSEGTPAALIEAMASGLPCVATATGGIPEVIEHGKNGFVFERENADDLAEKMLCILSDPELQVKFSKMAQQNLQKFSIDTYVNNVFSHYQNLLE